MERVFAEPERCIGHAWHGSAWLNDGLWLDHNIPIRPSPRMVVRIGHLKPGRTVASP